VAKVSILGVLVDNVDYSEALEKVNEFIRSGKKHYIVTPNPEQVVYAQDHSSFKKILNEADLAICDGVGLLWASRFLSTPLKERVSGVDLMEKICVRASQKGWKLGFLGGTGKTAKETGEALKLRYDGLKIEFAAEGDPRSDFDWELRKEIPELDVLFVAYGAPKQEELIARNLKELDVKVVMACGGAFDFVAGKKKRAPEILRNTCFEWLWRLMLEPWRIKRQMAIPAFVLKVFWVRISNFKFAKN